MLEATDLIKTFYRYRRFSYRIKHSTLWATLVIAVFLALVAPAVVHAQSESVVVSYAVPGDPLNVAVESPGHLWYTLPDQNAVGSLIVDETGTATTRIFTLPQANSRPYDIAYAAGTVWFTEREVDKIGAINVATGELREFAIPQPGDQPTGIAVAPNGIIWFVLYGSNQLGKFERTSESFDLYTYPRADAALEDISVGLNNSPWFTAPGVDAVVKFDYGSRLFIEIPSTGTGSGPFNIVIARSDTPWVTAQGREQVGYFLSGTASLWLWFPKAQEKSELRGIARSTTDIGQRIWFTDSGNNRVSQYIFRDNSITSYSLSLAGWATGPAGIAVDQQEHAWIAVEGAIIEWRPPYWKSIYLPTIYS